MRNSIACIHLPYLFLPCVYMVLARPAQFPDRLFITFETVLGLATTTNKHISIIFALRTSTFHLSFYEKRINVGMVFCLLGNGPARCATQFWRYENWKFSVCSRQNGVVSMARECKLVCDMMRFSIHFSLFLHKFLFINIILDDHDGYSNRFFSKMDMAFLLILLTQR